MGTGFQCPAAQSSYSCQGVLMRTRVVGSIVRLGVLLALGASSTITAAEKTALELLPPTTMGYLEVPQPAKVAGLLLDHPLAKEIERQPTYQKALGGREYQQLQTALKLVEEKLGMKWREAVQSLA